MLKKYFIISIFSMLAMTGCSNNKAPQQTASSSGNLPKMNVVVKNGPVLSSEKAKRHFKITQMAQSKSYGYTKENSIKVGGAKTLFLGPQNERKFLNGLTGPKGQPLNYRRLGSCCAFPLKGNSGGLLDVYAVTYEGISKPVLLYLNMYESGPLMVPVGFAAR